MTATSVFSILSHQALHAMLQTMAVWMTGSINRQFIASLSVQCYVELTAFFPQERRDDFLHSRCPPTEGWPG